MRYGLRAYVCVEFSNRFSEMDAVIDGLVAVFRVLLKIILIIDNSRKNFVLS